MELSRTHMLDKFNDFICKKRNFINEKVIPTIVQEPRLQSKPHEYSHAVKFPGKHRVDEDAVINVIRETLSSEHGISLYVHMPVCRYRCTFCHYPILVSSRKDDIELWVRTVIRESGLFQEKIPEVRDCKITSLYIGGGTPTLMDSKALETLVNHFRENYQLADNVEITLEGTPDSCTYEKISLLERLGVNRISVGIQTLNENILREVNRQHTAREALECINTLIDSNIKTVNFDLIYGFPNQTVESFISDLDQILSFHPTSITIYRIRLNRSDEIPTKMLKSYEKEPSKFPSLGEIYTMQAVARELIGSYGYNEEPSGWFLQPGSRVQAYVDRWVDQKPMIGFGWHTYSYSKWWEYHNYNDRKRYLTAINNGRLPISFGYKYDEDEQQKRFIAFKLKSQFQLKEDEFRAIFNRSYVWNSVVDLLNELKLVEEDSLKLNPVGKVLIEEFLEKFLIKSGIT